MSACFLVVINGLAHAESGDPDNAAIESQHLRGSSAVTPAKSITSTTNVAAPAPAPSTFPPTKVDPDPPPRRATPPTVPQAAFAPSWDLDGLYLWLGPSGAASRIDAEWDSTIGADVSVIRVRERDLLGAIGATLGASRWTVRGGGRIWLDGLIGTRLYRMVGVSAGPLLELSELSHPRWGGSVGLWAFVGVTPFVRAGKVEGLGNFVELGLHIALPVLRR
jgi:hypothetical protein